MSARRGIIRGGGDDGWGKEPAEEGGSPDIAPNSESLPWLEPVDAEDEPAETFISRQALAFGVVLLVMVLGALIWFLYDRFAAPQGDEMPGVVPLVQAPREPYRTPAGTAGDVALDGEADSRFEVAAGVAPPGSLDLSALPEDPVERVSPEAGDAAIMAAPVAPAPVPAAQTKPQAPKVASPAPTTSAAPTAPAAPSKTQPRPQTAATAPAPAPAASPAPAAAPAPAKSFAKSMDAAIASAPVGQLALQLGAFSSGAKANAAWKQFSTRYSYLAGLEKSVQPVNRDGKTLYRLLGTGVASRAQANDICARLKVAGESCMVVD